MQNDRTKLVLQYTIAIGVLAAGFYSLVIYPFVLDDLVKGAIISFMTLALQAVFVDQVSARVGQQQQSAFGAGLTATPTVTTTTAGPPMATTTVTPSPPSVDEGWDTPNLNTRGTDP